MAFTEELQGCRIWEALFIINILILIFYGLKQTVLGEESLKELNYLKIGEAAQQLKYVLFRHDCNLDKGIQHCFSIRTVSAPSLVHKAVK